MNAGDAPKNGRPGQGLESLDDADVADLWVMDPDTGNYELRSPGRGAVPAQQSDDPHAGLFRDDAPREGTTRAGQGGRAAARRTTTASRSEAAVTERPDTDEDERSTRPGRRAAAKPKSKAKKRIKWTAIGLAATLVVLAGSAYGYYLYLNSRIKKTQRSAGDEVPQSAADSEGRTPMNILLIGSDSRIGAGNEGYGDAGHAGLADTTILMHLSADRTNATLVSIPRDTMVMRPKCTVKGKTAPASTSPFPFNETLRDEFGGAPCTVATVEKMLGVQVDHYLMIDFKGVKEMTDAVGGVPINLCEPINDPVLPNQRGGTDLFLKAGEQRLQGENALKFLRARHAFGDGSDLARIEAQKSFLMALAREVKNNAKWSNPQALFDLAQAATGNLQVDDGLDTIKKLVDLGNEIKKVPEKRMAFTTLPNEAYPQNPDQRVQQRQPDAAKLWQAIKTDAPITKGDGADAAPPAEAPASGPATPQAPTVDPATMKVTVRNTTKYTKGKAVADQLSADGYKATSESGNSGRTLDNSVVRYPKGKVDAAKQLAAAVGLSDTALEESTTGSTSFEVVIGSDFPGLTDTAPATGKPGKTTGPATTATTAPPSAPSASDLKLNTADNTSCISTGRGKK
ncbi:LCP family protein [Yinghuangia aomiensis]